MWCDGLFATFGHLGGCVNVPDWDCHIPSTVFSKSGTFALARIKCFSLSDSTSSALQRRPAQTPRWQPDDYWHWHSSCAHLQQWDLRFLFKHFFFWMALQVEEEAIPDLVIVCGIGLKHFRYINEVCFNHHLALCLFACSFKCKNWIISVSWWLRNINNTNDNGSKCASFRRLRLGNVCCSAPTWEMGNLSDS